MGNSKSKTQDQSSVPNGKYLPLSLGLLAFVGVPLPSDASVLSARFEALSLSSHVRGNAFHTLADVDTATLATHNSAASCWMAISNGGATTVFDCTTYSNRHSGGALTRFGVCGTQATNAYLNGSGKHNINAIPNKCVTVGALVATTQPPTNPAATTTKPATTTTTKPPTTTTTTKPPVTKTSDDDDNENDDNEYRGNGNGITGNAGTAGNAGNGNAGNTGNAGNAGNAGTGNAGNAGGGNAGNGNAGTGNAGNGNGGTTNTGINMSILSTHNTVGDCWMSINEMVYDCTSYIPKHPGPPNIMDSSCGINATNAYNTINLHDPAKIATSCVKKGALLAAAVNPNGGGGGGGGGAQTAAAAAATQSWFQANPGLAIGVIVGAIIIGLAILIQVGVYVYKMHYLPKKQPDRELHSSSNNPRPKKTAEKY